MLKLFLFMLMSGAALAAPAKGNSGNQAKVSDPPKSGATVTSENSDKGAASSVAASSIVSSVSLSTSITAQTSDLSSGATSTQTTSSAQSTKTTSPDLSRLFGADNRPNITHVMNTRNMVHNEYFPGLWGGLLETVLNCVGAIAKCHTDGDWIKSLFDFPEGKNEFVEDRGGEAASLILYDLPFNMSDESAPWTRFTTSFNRSETRILDKMRFGEHLPVEDPWWPWAVYEAVFEAGQTNSSSDPSEKTAQDNKDTPGKLQQLILKMLTGRETIYKGVTSSNADEIWDTVLTKCDSVPVLFRWDDEWSIAMTVSTNQQGEKTLGWADAYPTRGTDEENAAPNKGTQFTSFSEIKEKIQTVVYIEDLQPFVGRPDTLKG